MSNLQNLQEETRKFYENYRVHKEKSTKAKAVMACCMLSCYLAFAIQKLAKKSMDVLGGKSTIGMILMYNRAALILAFLAAVVFVVFVARYKNSRRINGSMLAACIVGGAFLLYTIVYLSMCLSHIYSDYQGVSECSPKEYVLSTLGENRYVTFEDGGDYAHLVVPQDIYDELAKNGKKDGTNSDMLQTVEDSGYSRATLYDGSGVTVKYFFYSAIFDSAEIKADNAD
jgi:hypothetical protein